jgi:hypothetical protein
MSPAASSEREAAFAKNAVLDAGALAELREVTTAFERRLAGTPPIESVPPAASRAAAYRGRGTMPAPVFLPQARDVFVPGRSGELRLRAVSPGERFRFNNSPGIRITTANLDHDDADRVADAIAGLGRSAGSTHTG